ncbi:SprT-like family-domain-containing protein [Halteromyces radiatus]|uniref:SprT-like family-domain-containing protein n=1 Tax=Halteromyces radiatus TaxID=101107 RepID=UPI0022207072|nr:SprT-like family-domain-containing protein [Halteromyces radiatus]KAI8089700.1 SprT-like family-domain-containing protein [Halteromyces radiatus]
MFTTGNSSNSTHIETDEDIARRLQQEEERLHLQYIRMTALVKADEAFAERLQQDLQENHIKNDEILAEELQQEMLKESNALNSTTTITTATSTTSQGDNTKTTSIESFFGTSVVDLTEEEDPDMILAKQLQKEEEENKRQISAMSTSANPLYALNDEQDPNPDLHGLFLAFNDLYFSGKLGMVEVKWSKRMTSCAGTCTFHPTGGLCTVTLSEALLKFRPRTDMINTLLHEMIHALLFVTKRYDNHESHGPEFLAEATRINKLAGTNITVYHTFHDEVRHYKTHVWQCNGPCKHRAPYFGKVSRTMNRPPQKADRWFAEHQATCGGTFVKISSPEPTLTGKKRKKRDDDAIGKKMTDYLLSDSQNNHDKNKST